MSKARDTILLIFFDEKTGVEKAIETLQKKQNGSAKGTEPSKPLSAVLVAYKNLHGAVYHTRTVDTDYWDKENTAMGPGRTSVIFDPMYMEEKALISYLDICETEKCLPVILADKSTAERRSIKSDTSVVGREFYGLREIAQIIAEREHLTLIEQSFDTM